LSDLLDQKDQYCAFPTQLLCDLAASVVMALEQYFPGAFSLFQRGFTAFFQTLATGGIIMLSLVSRSKSTGLQLAVCRFQES
jgi:hypothetical protein